MKGILNSAYEVAASLKEKAALIRKWCLISTTEAGSGHPTSCLSAADLTTVLFDKYFRYDLEHPLNLYNDRFVLSKGHAAPLLYALFGVAGAYPLNELKTLRKFGSRFQGHPVPRFVFSEAATGSLGQGLSVGAGLALLAKREKLPSKTYVLLGDGELAEGQIWEAANFAAYHRLDNLIAIADINRLAQSGETMFGHHMDEYADRFRAFGFEVITIDGHRLEECDHALEQAVYNNSGKPVTIIMKTVKGKGISFLEDKEGWHGKALNPEQLQLALAELGETDDRLRFTLKKREGFAVTKEVHPTVNIDMTFQKGNAYGLREVFGQALARLGKQHPNVYALDADVKNSTFTQDFAIQIPDRFVECYIAEQNMVSVAVGLSRLGKMPFICTFGAFFTRAADQIRMARVSGRNIKFVGSHVGVSIGEDGPSQMALEDIALFGAVPDCVIFQPADAAATVQLTTLLLQHQGLAYMRILRPKTKLLYGNDERFHIGGSKVLRHSDRDLLTIAATGITVFEALSAADQLRGEGIFIRVVDCYSISPIDKKTLATCLQETRNPFLITVEDHFEHGGMGDFAAAALCDLGMPVHIEKMAVSKISQSGKMEQLLDDAGISAAHLVARVKELLSRMGKG